MASECHISTNGSGWRCKILCIPLRKNPFHNAFLRKKTTKLNQQIALEQNFHTYQSYDIVDWHQLLYSFQGHLNQITFCLSCSPCQALGGLKFQGPGEELDLTNTPKSAILKWPTNRCTSSQFTMLGHKNSHVVSPKSAENLDVNLGFAVAGQGLQHTPRIDGKRWRSRENDCQQVLRGQGGLWLVPGDKVSAVWKTCILLLGLLGTLGLRNCVFSFQTLFKLSQFKWFGKFTSY